VNKKEGLPRVKKHIDNLIYNQEYFSFLFNFVTIFRIILSPADKIIRALVVNWRLLQYQSDPLYLQNFIKICDLSYSLL